MEINESLLRAILSMLARQAYTPEAIMRIVAPTSGSEKQLIAYNLCDGLTPQSEIAKTAKIDPGNLSRSIGRWVEQGVCFRIGTDQLPLHAYKLSEDILKKAQKKERDNDRGSSRKA